MLLAGLDHEVDSPVHRVRIGRVVERRRDVDVDAAHRVDDLDHAPEVGDQDGIDRSLRELRDRCPDRADALGRAGAGPAVGVPERRLDIERVEQVGEAATRDGITRLARRERRVDQVPRDADHADLPGVDVDLDQEHDVHPPAPAVRAGVRAEQQQVELAVVAPGHGAGALPGHGDAQPGQ